MYLNEKAWEIPVEDPYLIDKAMKEFLNIYAAVKRRNPRMDIFVPENESIYLRTVNYPIQKWLASADREYQRLYLLFKNKHIYYRPEEDYEVSFEGDYLKGGTEAYLNNFFMISLCLGDKWKRELIDGEFCSMLTDEVTAVTIKNVFSAEQLNADEIQALIDQHDSIKVASYTELWQRRGELFPHLNFCPSVKRNLECMELVYIQQVMKRLIELEKYCSIRENRNFEPSALSKTTLESESTLKKYKEEHTFIDESGIPYIASWHMRFTGIPGRIFFIPEYRENSILICYIGKKLPNVTYPT